MKVRKNNLRVWFAVVLIVAVLISKQLPQTWALTTLIDHVYNPRFLIPLQSAVVFWTLWIGYTFWRDWRMNRELLE